MLNLVNLNFIYIILYLIYITNSLNTMQSRIGGSSRMNTSLIMGRGSKIMKGTKAERYGTPEKKQR